MMNKKTQMYFNFLDQLSPDVNYGKLVNDTELIVAPYRGGPLRSNSVGDKLNGVKTITTDQIIKNHLGSLQSDKLAPESLKSVNKSNGIINGIRNSYSTNCVNGISDLDVKSNVSKRNSLIWPDTRHNLPSIMNTSDYEYAPKATILRAPKVNLENKLEVQQKILANLIADLRKTYKKQYQFRIIPTKWEDSQMCDLFTTRHNIPGSMDIDQIYGVRLEFGLTTDPLITEERPLREFYVNIKTVSDGDVFSRNIYPTIEMNDILMAQLNLKPLDRITLSPKQTVLNLFDRIELYPSVPTDSYQEMKTMEEAFKQLIIDETKLFPILINQNQLFRLADGRFIVTVKIFPETFRYCLCDSDALRECKINCVEQVKDVSAIMLAAEKVGRMNDGNDVESRKLIQVDQFQAIIDGCTTKLIFDLCLDDRNCLSNSSNFMIVGK